MSVRDESGLGENFRQDLWQLRLAINAVPEERRPALRELASQIEQRQCRIESDCARACEMADDLSLNLTSVTFNVWACKNEADYILTQMKQKAN
jgi:hypothetical protein